MRVCVRRLPVVLLGVAWMVVGVGWVSASAALGAGDSNRGNCPAATELSPGFRSSLPDCRAYELVTPPSKNGEPPTAEQPGMAVDGSRLVFSSLGAFGEPGNDSTATGVNYIGVRGPSGWSATPVNPSAEQFQGHSPNLEAGATDETLDYSADLSQSIFQQAPIGAKPIDSRFYIRRLDGSSTEVGPLLAPEVLSAWRQQYAEESNYPNPGYRGATGDLSHVFFDLRSVFANEPFSYLWPGDETASVATRSLYEYVGTGNPEPELVGVRNQTSLAEAARAQGKHHINEAAEQITQCGTALGGVIRPSQPHTGESYNAFSASGETVFFSALQGPCENAGHLGTGPAVNEIYARLERKRTVAISEPTTGPEGDCEACDESEPERAIFQGASEDGSKVFFISEQRLLPGAGAGTNLYEYDFDAPAHRKVALLATGLVSSEEEMGGVARVSEDGAYVYFVSAAKLASNADARGEEAREGEDNLYVRGPDPAHPGQFMDAFVGALTAEDHRNWNGEDARPVRATPDGRFLLFASASNLTPDATGDSRQLYRYEAPSQAHPAGVLIRVSVGENGFNDNGNAAAPPSSSFSPDYGNLYVGFANFELAGRPANAITNDGSEVFFETPTALVQGALDNVCAYEEFGFCSGPAKNIYEWRDGHVYLLSDGQDAHARFRFSTTTLIGANPSGSDVFFSSGDSLVPADSDTQVDLYDARVDGGFPAPAPAPACQGEACQGALSGPPGIGTAGSLTPSGGGNLSPPVSAAKAPTPKKAARCAKGRKLSHGKCLKAKAKGRHRPGKGRKAGKTSKAKRHVGGKR